MYSFWPSVRTGLIVVYSSCRWAFFFFMTHVLDLIPVCLLTPNSNCYLGQTAVLVLMEADVGCVYEFHSSAFFRAKAPL